METHTYPHLPAEVSTVHVTLFFNVSNAAQLRNRLIAAANISGDDGEREREAVNYAFVEANLITSLLHVQTAVYQAILAYVQGSLRTKTVHSEVLWALSPGHNISEAIKRFGVSDSTKSLLLIRICPPSFTPSDFETNAALAVKGNVVPLSSLDICTDWELVRKYYKLNADPVMQRFAHKNIERCTQDEERVLVDQLVVSTVAMKSVSA
ncbi:CGI-121-domain-containing protein [Ramaria rubella]|nr:CGI-121-domain-containing protein [Ramaria rubella]